MKLKLLILLSVLHVIYVNAQQQIEINPTQTTVLHFSDKINEIITQN